MTIQLTDIELESTRQLLQDYQPAQEAITILGENNGLLEASFEQLWQAKNRVQSLQGGKSFWEVTKKVLRNEICSNEGFRAKIKEYLNSKDQANASSLLTGAIGYLVGSISISIDSAIATIIVLYIMKVGLDIFCEYTDRD
ncbi:MAG: hypothetical protein AAGA80_04645 [Cyanobacteria bacterium P01_F01_bin.143]